MVRAESPAWGIGSGNWPLGSVIRLAHHAPRWQVFLLHRAPDAAAERPRAGSFPAPPPNLTHMSLDADAHVMTRPPGHLTLTHMSYSTPGSRPDADRHSGRMLR